MPDGIRRCRRQPDQCRARLHPLPAGTARTRQARAHIAIAFDESLDSRASATSCIRPTRPTATRRRRSSSASSRYCQARVPRARPARAGATADYEADDLIGTALGHAAPPRAIRGVIVSADKDLSQLLDADDEQWDYARNERWSWRRRQGALRRARAPDRRLPGPDRRCGRQHSRRAGHRRENRGDPARRISAAWTRCCERIDEVPFLRLRGSAQHAARLREHREHRAAVAASSRTIALRCAAAGRHFGSRRRASARLMPPRSRPLSRATALRPDDPPPPAAQPAARLA